MGGTNDQTPDMKLNQLEVNHIVIKSPGGQHKMVLGATEYGVGIVISNRLDEQLLSISSTDNRLGVDFFGSKQEPVLSIFKVGPDGVLRIRDRQGQPHHLLATDLQALPEVLRDEYITPGSPLDLKFYFHPHVDEKTADAIQQDIMTAAREILIRHLKLDVPTLGPDDEIVEDPFLPPESTPPVDNPPKED